MVDQVTKWDSFVRQLADETTRGQMRWRPLDLTVRAFDVYGPIFAADVQDQRVIAFEHIVPYYDDVGTGTSVTEDREVSLHFLDVKGHPIWEFPKSKYRWRLMEAIKMQQVDPEAFVDAYLQSHITTEQSG